VYTKKTYTLVNSHTRKLPTYAQAIANGLGQN